MRLLIVGAGAVGGYFGGMLLAAGRDVTFLDRGNRHAQLARDGLRINSPHGDWTLVAPTVRDGALGGPYDVVMVALKHYALAEAMEQFAPAIGPGTAILPVINGMRHIEQLSDRFGAGVVLAGAVRISATIDDEGRIVSFLPELHMLTFGELDGGRSPRVAAIEAVLSGAGFPVFVSELGRQDLWNKWCELAALAATTCLMRGTLGDIARAPGGREIVSGVLAECAAVAAASGHALDPAWVDTTANFWATSASQATASMLRDIERGSPTEGEHILGDLVERATAAGVATPLLALARCHVGTYEARRRREAGAI
jgi:2-dehydropantoate 2-reductase